MFMLRRHSRVNNFDKDFPTEKRHVNYAGFRARANREEMLAPPAEALPIKPKSAGLSVYPIDSLHAEHDQGNMSAARSIMISS